MSNRTGEKRLGGGMSLRIGWDLGGAHVKAALCRDGVIRKVWQLPCPLWRGLEWLDQAVAAVVGTLPACDHGVTMTGEMADVFPHREAGVRDLLARFAARVQGKVYVFTDGGFIPLSKLDDTIDYRQIASQNWQIPARWLSRQLDDAIYLDVGSTTTDIAVIAARRLMTRGRDDHQRLRNGELLYLGVVRTPLMALTSQVPFQGHCIPLMAEHFATTADVYRILERLPSEKDQAETADGGDKTVEASMRRLARMIGRDFEDAPPSIWRHLARSFHEILMQRLTLACLRHCQGVGLLVGAGVGRFLLPELARRLDLSWRDFDDFVTGLPGGGFTAGDCAPAAALALMLDRYLRDDKMNSSQSGR